VAALAHCPSAARFIESHKSSASAPASAVTPSDPTLRQRLLDMEQRDQQIRQNFSDEMTQADIENLMAVDAAHLPQIKEIVAQHDGLPDAAKVGMDGVAAAWILVQHADADPAFQESVLEKMIPLVKSEQISAREHALLTDRVLVNNGKPQRYGSQLGFQDGKLVPKPMEAPEQVDQRRAAIGEMPLADYVCVLEQLFGSPPAGDNSEAVTPGSP
jgi:hypothetical protein